ncbi:MAG: hypothetical protein WC863_04590 [Patescibacteria group bacterium]
MAKENYNYELDFDSEKKLAKSSEAKNLDDTKLRPSSEQNIDDSQNDESLDDLDLARAHQEAIMREKKRKELEEEANRLKAEERIKCLDEDREENSRMYHRG